MIDLVNKTIISKSNNLKITVDTEVIKNNINDGVLAFI
jgi:hypothetical protein